MLSHAAPYFDINNPSPPPSVRPAIPTVGQPPDVVAEALRCVVQVAYQRTCLCPGHALACFDFDPVHPGEIDHHAAIAHAEPGSVMATHRQWHILALDKIESQSDVGCAGTAHDQRRTLIECAVEDQAC
jgi:hypothetical protein